MSRPFGTESRKRCSDLVTSTRPVGSIDGGTRTTPPGGTVRGVVSGVLGGRLVVAGALVVDPACELPLDPPLHAVEIATTPNASSTYRVRRSFVDRGAMKRFNLPPRGVPIVMLLRL
jgi:hypothetical protein